MNPPSGSKEEPQVDGFEMPIAVVGSGGFGTTLAVLLAQKGFAVNQWVRDPRLAHLMQDKRENQKYLPGVTLPLNIYITERIEACVQEAGIVVVAVPSQAVREVAERLVPHLAPGTILVNVAKGIEHDTYLRMSEVLQEVLRAAGRVEGHPVVALSGPNHAEEIGRGMPTATVVASDRPQALATVVKAFSTHTFKVFPHSDVVGVELGGVTKNIVAIATGICQGIGYGDNATAAIITLGLSEMIRFGRHHGAKRETFMGLAGLGDLIATCTSKHSRNRYVGEHLGRGEDLDAVIRGMGGKVAEGVQATRFVHESAERNGIPLPLTSEVYRVLYENKNVREGVRDLLRLI